MASWNPPLPESLDGGIDIIRRKPDDKPERRNHMALYGALAPVSCAIAIFVCVWVIFGLDPAELVHLLGRIHGAANGQ